MLYACDGHWWKRHHGVPKFTGLKLSHGSDVCADYRDIQKIEVVEHDRMMLDDPGVVGYGGNSGFQALNLAVQFGATRIILIGFDMHAADGLHWHGHHGCGLINPHDLNFVRWRAALNGVAAWLREHGIEVINGSAQSALTAYPKMTLEDALKGWRL